MRAEISFGKSLIGILFVGLAAASCTTTSKPAATAANTKTKQGQPAKVTFNYTAKDRDCLQRAMYFESQHSDEDGYMLRPKISALFQEAMRVASATVEFKPPCAYMTR